MTKLPLPQAFTGLSTGVKQGEKQVMFAADMTVSAFLRTDINLVEWMADVGSYHMRPSGARVWATEATGSPMFIREQAPWGGGWLV